MDTTNISKFCPSCKATKSATEFNQNKSRSDKLSGWCKSCDARYAAKARWRNQFDERRKRQNIYNRKLKYGITNEQYIELERQQNMVCAICKIPSEKALHVDHCHKTGKIRGLLCLNCNWALGQFKDNLETIANALEYLKTS